MLRSYYSNPAVRRRMLEFLGGHELEDVTAVYITAEEGSSAAQFRARPPSDLWNCLDQELEIGRSLWDREHLVAHLDIEYVNFDFLGEPYLAPGRTFDLQRPVVRAIQRILVEHGIAPLHLLSGRGHHFVWQLRRASYAFDRLAALGARARASQFPRSSASGLSALKKRVEPSLAAAFLGLGTVIEYLAHRVLAETKDECEIPVQLTAVEVGPGARGREIVSIDISEYGDPLRTRGARMPFSVYLKPMQQRDWLGHQLVEAMPPLFMIPLFEMNDRQGLDVMRDLDQVRDLAQRASARIPDESASMERLIAEYTDSELSRFHEHFYRNLHDPPESWPHTYDRMPLETLPACARVALEQPNDLLLKPGEVQHLVRVLMAVGWEPRHIAGLIRSKYERDYGWGERWLEYDPAQRADFYTRIFAGLIATGLDELLDFNCRSTQEKQYCPVEHCGSNLVDWRADLMSQRKQTELEHG